MKLEAERGYERAAHLFSSEKIYNDTIKEYDLAIAHTKHIKETI